MLDRIRDLLIPGERRIFDDFVKLLNLGQESLEILIQLLTSGYTELDLMKEGRSRITELEKKGDIIVTELEKTVATGAISPPLIDDFLRLSERVDGILDLAHSMSRELSRVQKYRGNRLGEEEKMVYSKVADIVRLGSEAVQELKKMVNDARSHPSDLTPYTEKIEEMEERADDFKDSLLDEIYSAAEKMPYYVHDDLVRLTLEGDDLLDRCEDASDIVAVIVAAIGL